MKDDPTIQAIRDVRHRISKSVGHDPRKLVEYFRRLQEQRRARIESESKSSKKDETAA